MLVCNYLSVALTLKPYRYSRPIRFGVSNEISLRQPFALAKLCVALIFFIFITTSIASAQNTIVFESSLDRKKVALNEYVEISFAVRNAQPDAFIPPAFNDFSIAGGPNQSSEMSIINGAVSRNITYSFYLAPKTVGVFTIPPAIIKYRSKEFQTKSQTVEVVKANGKAANARPNPFAGLPNAANSPKSKATKPKSALTDVQLAKGIFVKAELNKREAFVGEQVTVEYKLYTRYPLSGKQFTKLPQLKGFFPVEFKQFDSNTKRENIGGASYAVQTLRKVALYPQEAGSLTIDALGVEVGVIEDNADDPFSDPFFGHAPSVRPYEVGSIPMTITVKSLPREQPKKFSGAVGVYSMQSIVVPTDVTTDDAVAVTLTITGNGDPKRIGAPSIGLDDSTAFEIYEPKVTDRSEETANDITGQKNYEITLIPRKVGDFTIAPSFTYFDTQTKQYKTLAPKTFDIHVARGKKPIVAYNPLDSTSAKSREPRLLRPQKTSFTVSNTKNVLLGSRLFWLLCATPFLGIIAMFAYKRSTAQRENLDTNALRQQRATSVAQQRLAQAQICHKNNDDLAFYNAIQKAILGYTSDNFGIANADLNKPFLQKFLQQQNIETSTIRAAIQILEQCEMAVFGGFTANNTMQRTQILAKTNEIITIIEAITKK